MKKTNKTGDVMETLISGKSISTVKDSIHSKHQKFIKPDRNQRIVSDKQNRTITLETKQSDN